MCTAYTSVYFTLGRYSNADTRRTIKNRISVKANQISNNHTELFELYYGYIFARSEGLSIQLAMHELGGPLVAEGPQAAA